MSRANSSPLGVAALNFCLKAFKRACVGLFLLDNKANAGILARSEGQNKSSIYLHREPQGLPVPTPVRGAIKKPAARTLVTALGTAVLLASAACGTIIKIPDDYPSIQEGLNRAPNGDTVLVQPGTYRENLNFNGHRVVLASHFLISGDTAYLLTTIIDGNKSGTVISFESGEDSTAAVIGFTIRNGHDRNGGGIYCSNSSPTVSNNVVTGNSASGNYYDGGGGIYCFGSSPVIRSNIISGNTASPNGGGIYCKDNSNPLIIGNLLTGNSVHGPGGTGARGGAIGCTRSSPRIVNNIITGNSAQFYGGGISCWYDSDCAIVNNIICENSADMNGGGIHCNSNSNPSINNNTISENWASDRGGGICCHWDSGPRITNTIMWGDSAASSGEIQVHNRTPTVTYSDIQGGWQGEGNIDSDPLFRDPAAGDYHLQGSKECGDSLFSPCVDAGHPDSLDMLLDCLHGLGNDRADVGAYGGRNSGWSTGEGDN